LRITGAKSTEEILKRVSIKAILYSENSSEPFDFAPVIRELAQGEILKSQHAAQLIVHELTMEVTFENFYLFNIG